MSEGTTTVRLSKAAREFNIGVSTLVDFLLKKGFTIEKDPNSKLSEEMYSLLMKEFATEKHVKEEAKKIGLNFAQHETITIDNKRLISKDNEKELDEPLYIKNAALEYNTKLFDSPKKASEPVKEIPKEEKKKEEISEKEILKPQQQKAVTEIPPEKVTQKTKEKTPVETEKKKTAKPTKKKKVDEVIENVKPDEVPEVKVEEPDKTTPGIKIVGKLDLDAVGIKPSKKGKGKKGKVEEPIEELLPEPFKIPLPESAIEVSPVIWEEEEIIEEPVEEPPKVEDNFIPREKINLVGSNHSGHHETA